MKLTIIYHHYEDDPGCIFDYYEVTIHDAKGKKIASYGDEDEASEKIEGFIEGFIDGVKWAVGENVKTKTKRQADYKVD